MEASKDMDRVIDVLMLAGTLLLERVVLKSIGWRIP